MTSASKRRRQRRVKERSSIGKDLAFELDVHLRPAQTTELHRGGMKLFTTLLGALALIAGVAGGMQAYHASAAAAPAPPVAVSTHPPAQVVRPGVVVRWAPCRPPAVRQGVACVRHVTKTVTRAAPTVTVPVAPVTTPPAAPVRTVHPASVPPTHEAGDHEDSSDDGSHHEDEGDDGGEHHEGEDDD